MSKPVIGFVFARGGSRGVPGKNIREIDGKPLIAYAIETAKQVEVIVRVIVSTDDEEIAQIARQYGAETPFIRPAHLAQDKSSEWSAWQHAIREIEKGGFRLGTFVSIPPTSPLRNSGDIAACIALLNEGNADLVYTVTETDRNPYFNMVTVDDDGFAHVAISPDKAVHRRQDAPVVYDSTTVAYAARPEFILNHDHMFEGRVKVVVVPAERALDIDSELDFSLAEFYMKRRSPAERM